MLDPPQILTVASRPAAVIRLEVPRSAIRDVMGPALDELRAALDAQGVAPSGPWFSHHLRIDPARFEFEVGIPVDATVVASGRMVPGRLPAARLARAVYRGGYEGLGAAWGQLGAWLGAEGHTPGPDLWECYEAGPESSPDPADWRTELNRPLIGPA